MGIINDLNSHDFQIFSRTSSQSAGAIRYRTEPKPVVLDPGPPRAETELAVYPSILPFSFSRVSAFMSVIMAPQLNTAQHILIENLLKARFETKLIASEASCSRARRPENPSEETSSPKCPPTPHEQTVKAALHRPCRKSLCDVLVEQPDLYRCGMADFLYRRFRKKNIKQIDRSDSAINRLDENDDPSHRTTTGMPTFEITIYMGCRSTSPTNLSLWMSLAAMEGLDIGVGASL